VKPVIIPLVEQHAAEVAALTMLRTHAVSSPRHHRREVDALDRRIAAHLDGLCEAGEAGWRVVRDAVAANPEVGEATAVIALALSLPAERTRRIAEAFVALELLPIAMWQTAGAAVRGMDKHAASVLMAAGRSSGDHRHHLLALGAAMTGGRAGPPPTGLLAKTMGDTRTAAVAAEAVGVLGDDALRPTLRKLLTSDDLATRFAAARALVLRGNEPAAWRVLAWFAESRSPVRHAALDLAIRHAPPGSHVQWLHTLISDPSRISDALVVAGAWGDPLVLSWLVKRMRDPVHARRAGAMFTLITGVDLDAEELSLSLPDDAPPDVPTDDPEDGEVEPDPDHGLPWPAADAVAQWLNAHPLPTGIRHLAGHPITTSSCAAILADGFQHQRQAAALELVRLTGGVLTAL